MANTSHTAAQLLPNPKAKLFDQVREVMRFHHYSLRTEKAYLQWIKRFLVFHRKPTPGPSQDGNAMRGWRHPREMGAEEAAQFLSQLAMGGNVAASTQNQAHISLVVFYGKELQMPLRWL